MLTCHVLVKLVSCGGDQYCRRAVVGRFEVLESEGKPYDCVYIDIV